MKRGQTMNLSDQFNISIDGYHVSIEVDVSPSIIHTPGGRPRWKLQYEDIGDGAVAAMEEIRESLEELDDEEPLPVGTRGFSVGDIFIEHQHNENVLVKNDDDKVLGELTEEQLMESLQNASTDE